MKSTDLRGDDVIDSRDVIERIKELQEERQDLQDALGEATAEYTEATDDDAIEEAQEAKEEAQEALNDWDTTDEAEELKDLLSLAEEGERSPDWSYGETLIKDEHFEEYAQELAEDIGAVNKDQWWPNNCIDWKEAAEQLQQDYFSVTFGSDTYWIRS